MSTGAGGRRRPQQARDPRRDVRLLTAAGWLVGLGCTGLIIGSDDLLFGYRSPELHLVLDTADASVALLLAYLLHGRYRRTRVLQDLMLAEALLLLAVAGLGLSLAVEAMETYRQSLGAWLPLSLRVQAAVLILAAALAGRRVVVRRGWRAALVVPAVAVATVVLLTVLRDHLPVAVSADVPASAADPVVTGHVVLLGCQALAAVCFLLASVVFTAEAGRRPDEVLRWLGPACALGGFARVNYVLFPSLYSDHLYTGDVLRTACYLCLLVGASREISRYWADHAKVAVVEDRRRLARELHDGVVQELSLIKAEARSRSDDPGPILAACDRALDEARAAVDAMGRDSREPLGYALHRAARDVADRHGGHVVVSVDDGVAADAEQRHQLARITREAVGNAVRHGRADCVRVVLEQVDGRCRLVVQDDGSGFDSAEAAGGTGFGLTSMRERAQALPGSLALSSAPGEGTTVEVTW